MIVGPTKALFMDEISNGLDSSTTFQIVSCLQHLAHIIDATALISLLQPAPETFDLFDDIILMAEGKIVYHGPRTCVLQFFEDCGFKCPERKGAADFLQEVDLSFIFAYPTISRHTIVTGFYIFLLQVISSKDQAQYWHKTDQPYSHVSVDQFAKIFKDSHLGHKLDEELSKPFDKSHSHKNALSSRPYSLTKWGLFKACTRREFLLMRRNSFIYVFKSTQVALFVGMFLCQFYLASTLTPLIHFFFLLVFFYLQLVIIASIAMTVFLRTEMAVDTIHANYYMGSLFYALLILLVDGFPELPMTVSRLAVFYKQKDLFFYPAWAYAIPSAILKVPLSFLEAFVWTALTYYVIGYSPEVGR